VATATNDPVSAVGKPSGARRKRPEPDRGPDLTIGAIWLMFKVLVPVVLVVGIAVGVLFVRLQQGPISLKTLAAPIARSIAAELQGLTVGVDDAIVHLTEEGAIEFRLRNVRFADADGIPIATAPLAAVSMSLTALLKARLAPARIVLIEPRLLLLYSEEGGLAYSFSRGVEGQEAAGTGSDAKSTPPTVPAATPSGSDPVGGLHRIDLARSIAELAERARGRADAASYLETVGVRNATVILDHSGHQSIWRLISGELDLVHKSRHSSAAGSLTFASSRGPWNLTFKIDDHGKERVVVLNGTVRDLVPRTLAGLLPQLAVLDVLDFPVAGDIQLVLSSAGELSQGRFALDLARGALLAPGAGDVLLDVDSGRIEMMYDPPTRRFDITRASLISGGGGIEARGAITPVIAPDGGQTWGFDLRSSGGMIAADVAGTPPLPIEEAAAQGTFDARSGTLTLTQAVVRAGGSRLAVAGRISGAGAGPPLHLDGQMGPTSLTTLKALWPRTLAPAARRWMMQHVKRAQVQGASLRMTGLPPTASAIGRPASRDGRLAFTLEAADIVIQPAGELAPVEAARGLLRIEDNGLEITLPEAAAVLPGNRRIALKGGRFTAVDIYGDRPMAEIAFRVQGGLPAVLDYVAKEPIAITRPANVQPDAIDGKVDGQFKVTLPLFQDGPVQDVKVEAKVRLTDGRARQLIGHHDVQGGSVQLDIGEKALEARGEMLIAGVPAKLTWQRFPGQPEDRQPPLRIMANLDASDRAQLGLDVNHIAIGDTPVELTVTRGPKGELAPRVRVDLTSTELLFENLTWRKPPGRPASVQFDVVKGTRHKTELHNFQLVGEDIAIDGWLGLDQANRLREFQFHDFSINVVSRLDLQGTLRPDNVWDVKARGTTYDGREFFRSLFSVGQITDKPVPPRKSEPGLDLKAEVDNVLGYSDVSIKRLSLQLSKRQGKLTHLIARGTLDNGRSLDAGLQVAQNEPRKLVALSDDAGRAFKLVGFYPNLQGGRLRLEVNLDGRGAVEKSGTLFVEQFSILGDPVVSEMLSMPGESPETTGGAIRKPGRQQVTRQVIEFDWMRLPFSVGNQQMVLTDAELRGPLVGAVIRGKADFRNRVVNLGGTYVPLQGLNAAIGAIPGLGQLFAGPRGEGVLGITFAVQGPMAHPQVIVNPLSLLTPGLTREMMQLTNPTPRVTPTEPASKKPAPAQGGSLSSSAPAAGAGAQRGAVQPRVDSDGGWSSQTLPPKAPAAAPARSGDNPRATR
jgi:hypothetical protein